MVKQFGVPSTESVDATPFVIDRQGTKKRKKTSSAVEEPPPLHDEKPAKKAKDKKAKRQDSKDDAPESPTDRPANVTEENEMADELSETEVDPKRKRKAKEKESNVDEEKQKKLGTKRGTEAGRLDEATLPYVREVSTLAKADDFETDEDRSIFVENVWRELKMNKSEQLVRLITHKEGSVAVQSLLRLSTPRQLYRVCRGLKGVLSRVIFNPYGSHVLEALYGFIPRLVNASMDDFKQAEDEGDENGGEAGEALQTLETLFQDTCDELTGGWMEIMLDARGSHVLRAVLRALAGLSAKSAASNTSQEADGDDAPASRREPAQRQTHGSFRTEQWERHAVPASFHSRLRAVAEELSDDANASELASMALNSAAAPVLQLLLTAVRNDAALVRRITRAVLRWSPGSSGGGAGGPDKEWIGKLVEDESGSHSAEAVLELMDSDDLAAVYSVGMRGRLVQMARHRLANHVLQRLIEKATDAPRVRALMQELGPYVGELIQWNRGGVVLALANACARAAVCQSDLCRAVAAAFGLAAPQEHPRLVPSILRLRAVPASELADGDAPAADGAEDRNEASAAAAPQGGRGRGGGKGGGVACVLGSLLLQAMLQFEEAALQPVLTSLAALPAAYLVRLARDAAGSRALEGLVGAPSLPLKARQRLIGRVTEAAGELGEDRFGSHVVEACHRHATLPRKEALAAALAAAHKRLRGTFFGALVLRRCRVQQYMDRADEWLAAEQRADKKRSLFSDIIGAPAAAGLDDSDDGLEEGGGSKQAHRKGDGEPAAPARAAKTKGLPVVAPDEAAGKAAGKGRGRKADAGAGAGADDEAAAAARALGGGKLDGHMATLGFSGAGASRDGSAGGGGSGGGKKKSKDKAAGSKKGAGKAKEGDVGELTGGDRGGDDEIEALFKPRSRPPR